jgi:hypothetical protein
LDLERLDRADQAGSRPLQRGVRVHRSHRARVLTRDRAARELFGTKYSKNVQKLKRENEQLAEANEPIAQLTAMAKAPAAAGGEAGTTEAEGQGEDGADDKVEATSYPRRRRLELIANKEAAHVATQD